MADALRAGRPLDALDASKRAREYLETVHGQFALYDFRIEAATKENGNWRILCSYLPVPSQPHNRITRVYKM